MHTGCALITTGLRHPAKHYTPNAAYVSWSPLTLDISYMRTTSMLFTLSTTPMSSAFTSPEYQIVGPLPTCAVAPTPPSCLALH